ncbi:gluconate 2-dehydrogenase subunit 3 family protein [Euzebyella saccharophila]|uniref:Gluconate 2-dehydrogenase subunit 3 family protein n=1 Tax=Euzebyella saccharophila TaxID=679664 RepID=A0ABV8JWY9_9FLAO
MDRRKSIQTMILGASASAFAFHSCKTDKGEAAPVEGETAVSTDTKYYGRTPAEAERDAKLKEEQLFNEHEMETIAVLSEVILPPKEPHGGPLEADVPEFIEFIGKDMPQMQNTLLGGLMWLDHKSNTDYGLEFKSASLDQQKEILDQICIQDMEVPLDDQPLQIQFFALMKNLVVTGYYTSKVGIADLGYKGNQPNVWDGVPDDVLKKHGVEYDPEWIAKCVDNSKRNVIAEWDEDGNLLT